MPDDTVLLERHFDTAFAAPKGVQKLRELILTFAMQGKLVAQDPNDQPASELLKAIELEKQQLVEEGKIKQPKPLLGIKPDEVPYELPKSWKWVRLGETIILVSGQHLTPSEYNENRDGIPYYTGPADFGVRNPTSTRWTFIERSIAIEGDILLTVKGAGVGKTNVLADSKAAISRQLMALRTITIDKEFLHLFLKTISNDLQKLSTGIAIPGIGREDVLLQKFPLPPLAEQRRIVAKVDRLMAQCDELERLGSDRKQKRITVHTAAVNRLLAAQETSDFSTAWDFITQHFGELYSVKENVAELRKAILQLAVRGKLVRQDPNDQPAKELLKAIEADRQRLEKEEGLRTAATEHISESEEYIERPFGWEYCRLGNLARFIDYRGRTPKKVDAGIPLITAKNVRFGFINREPYEYITEDEYESWMTRGYPKFGDLLLTTEAPLGNVAVIDIQEQFALAQRVICLQLHEPEMANFLKWLVMSTPFQNQLLDNATGMTAKGIKSARLREIPIPFPPLTEQHCIVAKIDRLMALCDRLEQQIEAATSKRTELLNALMAQV